MVVAVPLSRLTREPVQMQVPGRQPTAQHRLVAWLGIWVSDQPPANSCMLQFEANLPVTALLQGSRGHG